MDQLTFAFRNFSDKLIKGVKHPSTFKFYWQTYVLNKLNKVAPNIYIVSYPKCGRTWLRFILQQYLQQQYPQLPQFENRFLLRLPQDMILKFEHDQGNWVPAPPKVSQLSFNITKYTGKKVIFMVRDPRDVLISSWYHLRYRENIYQGSLSEFIRDDLVGIHKVVAFMNLWLDNRHVPADFLLISYEQFHADSATHFRQILEFMNIAVDDSAVAMATQSGSFREMKKVEIEQGSDEPWLRPGSTNSENSMKIRKGKIGGFKEELLTEDIAYLNSVIQTELSPLLPYHQIPKHD
ncbi:MAG: sulfotransferase domain-containing protein [Anaerolineae bacterium]|nr:sulfotransferase domain-containing protein [Anaerolineae bacterium]